jgi:uncharacterized protein (TIGR02246 family)
VPEGEDIASVLVTLQTAWNELDAAAYARLFSSDAVYVTRGGLVWRGRPAIEEGTGKALAGALGDMKAALRPITVTFPAPAVGLALVEVILTGDAAIIRGVTTFVLVFDEDRWTIVCAQTTEVTSVH